MIGLRRDPRFVAALFGWGQVQQFTAAHLAELFVCCLHLDLLVCFPQTQTQSRTCPIRPLHCFRSFFYKSALCSCLCRGPVQTFVPSQRSVVIDDLLPSKEYFFRLRSHPSTAPSIVQGWRLPPGDVVSCWTKAFPVHGARHVTRVGRPQDHAIDFEWHAAECTSTVLVDYWPLKQAGQPNHINNKSKMAPK